MLAAGGTGGHLFPAFALAEELRRRGIAVDLMTDMRGDRYGSGFPARADLSGAIGDARVAHARRHRQNDGCAGARHQSGLHDPEQVKPSAVIGFGGYPTFPPLIAARLRGIPTAVHEQNAVLGRANKMLVQARHGDRDIVRAHEVSRRQTCEQGGADRQSGAPGGHRCGHAPLRRARPRWRRSHC